MTSRSWRRTAARARDRFVRRSLGTDLRATGADIAAIRRELKRQRRDLDELRRVVAPLPEIRSSTAELSTRLAELAATQQRTSDLLGGVAAELAVVHERVDAAVGLASSARDDLPALRRELRAARNSDAFTDAWDDPDPLVTVRIASYRDTESLLGRALPSVFAQTHANIEVVVVNDGPNNATRAAIESLADPRVRYIEFPFRRVYPEDRRKRWMVAGSPGMNEGALLARGSWVAPLDEDDEFTPDHVERLLTVARAERAELVYGAFDRIHDATGRHLRIFAFPPKLGGFTFQAAIYHAGLRFFEYDEESWRVDEPGDWNLCRRMLQAGVRIAAVDEIVGTMHHVALPDKPGHH